MTILLRRKQEMSHDEFVAYHCEKHAPLFMSLAKVKQHVRYYIQEYANQEQLLRLTDQHIDGFTELWFDDFAGLEGVFQSSNYMATVRPDEEIILDLHACEFLVGTENEVIPGLHA